MKMCNCPVHARNNPKESLLPLGVPFGKTVSISPVKKKIAAGIYEEHHSYHKSMPSTNILHHGIYISGNLVGAITWRQPLIKKITAVDADDVEINPEMGRLEPSEENYSTGGDLNITRDYDGGEIVEVAKICVAEDMPNLASCALAKSQDKFISREAHRRGLGLIISFITAAKSGSMFRALESKGWRMDPRPIEGKQAGNREDMEVRDKDKYRWTYEIEPKTKQTTLG